ncbi:hypothetical protein [Tomitella gaofuii]|uniref:hypothetical protein n=1 Tax=Tomitella gaofuii TaxID=2760083 RepID=UPI0015F803B6|nr:hypothetical protein [Tomitella gaofuii]
MGVDVHDVFEQANQSDELRAAVRQRATNMVQRARRIDAKETDSRNEFHLAEEFRRDGRYVVNVHSSDVEGEYGTSRAKRMRILRRAMGGR